MKYLPYIAGSYALGVLVPVYFAVTAWTRSRSAKRRLAALDTRRARSVA